MDNYKFNCRPAAPFSPLFLLAIFNVAWSLADRAAVRDLATPVTPAQVAFAPGQLAAQVFV